MALENLTAGILTISDRGARGEAEDLSGPALAKAAEKLGWRVEARAMVSDEEREIRAVLGDWCLENRVDLILTTGGTGLGPRDVTPEATKALIEKEIPGLSELIRAMGVKKNPRAALSRAVSGVRRKTLIINLPGSLPGALESLAAVARLIPHAVEIIRGGGHGFPPK